MFTDLRERASRGRDTDRETERDRERNRCERKLNWLPIMFPGQGLNPHLFWYMD